MTNQVQGEIIFDGWAGGGDATAWVYSPWIPVRGDVAVFAVEVLARLGGTLNWNVDSRTAEDSAITANILGADQTTGSVAVFTAENSTNVKQWVRYKFNTGNASASVANWTVLRALAPSWRVNR